MDLKILVYLHWVAGPGAGVVPAGAQDPAGPWPPLPPAGAPGVPATRGEGGWGHAGASTRLGAGTSTRAPCICLEGAEKEKKYHEDRKFLTSPPNFNFTK